MPRHHGTALLILYCIVFFFAVPAHGQDTNAPAGRAPGMDDMMKKMMALATPGAPHKLLAGLGGTWETSAAMFMPGMPASSPSKGTTKNTMILGGRFLQSDLDGAMMGMPMKGMGIMGYDNFAKKYFMFWVDNLGTTFSSAEGFADRDGKVITLYGRMDEPTTGEIGKIVKYVYRLVSNDKYVFEIHDPAIGEPNTKVMEVTYTRK
jgi:hypothetical protein